MDQMKFGVKRLSGDNYETWRYKMELFLMNEGLLEVATVETAEGDRNQEWIEHDKKARAIIGLSIEDSQVVHVRGCKFAFDFWKKLENYHQMINLTNRVSLLKRVCRMKLEVGGNMDNYILDFITQCEILVGMGQTMDEKLKIALILGGLPDSYNNIVIALETRPDDELNFDLVKEKLMQESKRRQDNNDDEKVLKIFHKKFNKAKNNYSSDKKTEKACFLCGKVGHLKYNCPQSKSMSKGESPAERAKYVMDEREICFMLNEVSNEHKKQWVIDSAASSHMTNDRDVFDYWKMQNQYV